MKWVVTLPSWTDGLTYQEQYNALRNHLCFHHGIDPDKHHLLDFGSQFIIEYTWKLAENISWKSRMYGFTSYKRVEYEWENTFSFQFNKYISSKLFSPL